jgi:hypothetical protein
MNRSYISLDFKYVYTEVSKKKIQVLTESIYTHTHAYTWMLKIKTVMIDNRKYIKQIINTYLS